MSPTEHDPAAKLLTVPEIAARLALKASTVERYRKEGRLPLVKFGGQWVMRESDLIVWLDRELKRAQESGE